MHTTIPYWHVDAFAARPFGGNQAAVMLFAHWPDDATMRAIAAENMFAETAFLIPSEDGAADFELRWFTPELEVALCGHATLASGHVLLSREQARESVRFATRKSGLLEVRRAGEGYELALPAIHVEGAAPDGLLAGMGAAPEEVRYDPRGYVLCRYGDEAAVRALTPDMAALALHGDTMFIATAPGEAVDVVSRVFVPGVGIPEDSVTGSAQSNCGATLPARTRAPSAWLVTNDRMFSLPIGRVLSGFPPTGTQAQSLSGIRYALLIQ